MSKLTTRANTIISSKLITRADAKDYSSVYGPEWHAPLPDVLRPKMVVKIGIQGEQAEEWPWATVVRALGDKIWLRVNSTNDDWDHGISSGREIEVRREHLHMVLEPDSLPAGNDHTVHLCTDCATTGHKPPPQFAIGDRVEMSAGPQKGTRFTVVEVDEENIVTLRGPCGRPGCHCVGFMRVPPEGHQYLDLVGRAHVLPSDDKSAATPAQP